MQRFGRSMLSIAFVATLAAQDKPDFSGHWVLASATNLDPDVPQSLTVKQTIARTNRFGVPMEPFFKEMTIERQYADHASADTYDIGTVGGRTGRLIGRGSQPITETHFSIRWVVDRLVIETSGTTEVPGQNAQHDERIEIWQLDPTGILTLTVSASASGIESQSKVLTYRRNY